MVLKVTCPTCESEISWKVLYAGDTEIAQTSLDKQHSTRCPACGCVFTYIPSTVTKTSRPIRNMFRLKTVTDTLITDISITKPGILK